MTCVSEQRIREALVASLDLGPNAIDWNASFINSGGSSEHGVLFISQCRALGIRLSLLDLFESDSLESLVHHLTLRPIAPPAKDFGPSSSLVCRKNGILNLAKGGTLTESALLSPSDSYEMTDMQTSFLIATSQNSYANIVTYREDHKLALLPQIKAAWAETIASEDIFSTEFDVETQTAFVFSKPRPLDWVEFRPHTRRELQCGLSQLIPQDPTSLYPCNRFRVFIHDFEGQATATILWHVHHSLVDMYSARILLARMRERLCGVPIRKGPSFARAARSLHKIVIACKAQSMRYWTDERQKFANAALDLDSATPSQVNGEIPHSTFRYNMDISSVEHLAKELSTSPAAVIHTAWSISLAKMASSNTVCFGSVFSGRHLPIDHVESTVGPILNTLPFNVTIDPASHSHELIRKVSSKLQRLTNYVWSSANHGFQRDFYTAINVCLFSETGKLSETSMRTLGRPQTSTTSDVPLLLTVESDGNLTLDYNASRVNLYVVRTLASIFSRCCQNLARARTNVSSVLDDCLASSYLDDVKLLGNCMSTMTRTKTISTDLVTLFKSTATENPTLTAVERGSVRLSYRELDALSSKVAEGLVDFVIPGDVVCVDADRSIEWIVAIYGILKAGAIYCPIDPALPSVYRDDILDRSGAKVFLVCGTQFQCRNSNLGLIIEVQQLLQTKKSAMEWGASKSLKRPVPEKWPAYLCFTSGSTGKPKGVLCSHGSLVAFQSHFDIRLKAHPGWRIAQFMSPGFDGAVHEIFSALSYGATLVLWSLGDSLSHLHSVDATMMTPSVARVVRPADFPHLECLYLAGEPVPQTVCDEWGANKATFNFYGPTETTCGVNMKRLIPNLPVTLGHPAPSARIYILDARGQLIPRGLIGEIHIAGIQVGLGYLGDEATTATRFVDDHIMPEYGEKMYKTGDRGYWNLDGELCIVGRQDRQVKLRGFRVDMDGVEACLRSVAPECSAVAVTRHEDVMLGFVQPRSLDGNAIRAKLSACLPAYALPQAIIPTDVFPLTRTGKLDYKSLLQLEQAQPAACSDQKLTPSEHEIAGIWRKVLHLPGATKIMRDSKFLELGGNSISQMILAHELALRFNVKIRIRQVMEWDHFGILADRIEDLMAITAPTSNTTVNIVEAEAGISSMERYWWSLYQRGGTSGALNVPFVCRLSPKVSLDRLESAWNLALASHPVWRQRYFHDETKTIRKGTLSNGPRVERVPYVNLADELQYRFDLTTTPPVRVCLSRDLLSVTISHIVSDMRSLKLLLSLVDALYKDPDGAERILRKVPNDIQPAAGAVTVPCDRRKFWQQYLMDAPRPTSNQQCPGKAESKDPLAGRSYTTCLSRQTCAEIHAMIASQGVTIHQIALAAVATISWKADHKPQKDIVLGSPHFNRSATDLDAFGLFLQPLPVRIHLEPGSANPPTSVDLLRLVRDSTHSAIEYAMPWGELLEAVGMSDRAEHDIECLFDTMVSVHDERQTKQFLEPHTQQLCVWTPGSKFKLLIELTVLADDVILVRYEYDNHRVSGEQLAYIANALPVVIRGLAENKDLLELASLIDEANTNGDMRRVTLDRIANDENSLFGAVLKDIRPFTGTEED